MCIRDRYRIDFIVLAGFLVRVPDLLLHAYPDKIINIHPALLPKFGGKGKMCIRDRGKSRTLSMCGKKYKFIPSNRVAGEAVNAITGFWSVSYTHLMKLMERNLENFTPDFVARKSVFCFDNRMICLGTGITNSNADYPRCV